MKLLSGGAAPHLAELEAQDCFNIWRCNTFKKSVAALMESHIAAAVKKTKTREKSTL